MIFFPYGINFAFGMRSWPLMVCNYLIIGFYGINELKKNNGPKKPDLFSLSGETELFQNEKGITIKIDRSRDSNLTDFGKATLKDRYLGQNESFQDLFARVASVYADDNLHAQRIYNYISNLWFMPATPVLSNGGTKRGMPISCFLNYRITLNNIIIFILITNFIKGKPRPYIAPFCV
jgi:hypothetical protein